MLLPNFTQLPVNRTTTTLPVMTLLAVHQTIPVVIQMALEDPTALHSLQTTMVHHHRSDQGVRLLLHQVQEEIQLHRHRIIRTTPMISRRTDIPIQLHQVAILIQKTVAQSTVFHTLMLGLVRFHRHLRCHESTVLTSLDPRTTALTLPIQFNNNS